MIYVDATVGAVAIAALGTAAVWIRVRHRPAMAREVQTLTGEVGALKKDSGALRVSLQKHLSEAEAAHTRLTAVEAHTPRLSMIEQQLKHLLDAHAEAEVRGVRERSDLMDMLERMETRGDNRFQELRDDVRGLGTRIDVLSERRNGART